MGVNKDLGLPYGDGMQRVAICFDVDGTLIDENENINESTLDLVIALYAQKWKNADIIIWSGGGSDYARTQFERIMKQALPNVKFHSKLEYAEIKGRYSRILAIDDVQDTRLGDINLIVRNK